MNSNNNGEMPLNNDEMARLLRSQQQRALQLQQQQQLQATRSSSHYEDELDSLAMSLVAQDQIPQLPHQLPMQQPQKRQSQPFPLQSINSSFDGGLRNQLRPADTRLSSSQQQSFLQQQFPARQQQSQSQAPGGQPLQRALEPFSRQQQNKIVASLSLLMQSKIDKATFLKQVSDIVGQEGLKVFISLYRGSSPSTQTQQQRSSGPSQSSQQQQQLQIQLQQQKLQQQLQLQQEQSQQQQQAPQPKRQKSSAQKQVKLQEPVENEPEGPDVFTMDSNSLQDVIQYAGVDLKAESALLSKSKRTTSKSNLSKKASNKQSKRNEQPLDLQPFIQKVASVYGLSKMDSECLELLLLALQAYMNHVLTATCRASLARLENGRDKYELDLVEGEAMLEDLPQAFHGTRSRIAAVKRPLVWLEKHDRKRDLQLALELNGGVSEEGYQAWIDNAAATRAQTDDPSSMDVDVDGTQSQQQPSQQQQEAKRERVDQAISARMTNNAALQAAGLQTQKYSWMNSTSSQLNESQGSSTEKPASKHKPQQPIGFGLPRANVRRKILEARRVEIQDLEYAIKYAIKGTTQTRMRSRMTFERGVARM